MTSFTLYFVNPGISTRIKLSCNSWNTRMSIQPRDFYRNRTLSQRLKHKDEHSWQCDYGQLGFPGTHFHYSLCYSLDWYSLLVQLRRLMPGTLDLANADWRPGRKEMASAGEWGFANKENTSWVQYFTSERSLSRYFSLSQSIQEPYTLPFLRKVRKFIKYTTVFQSISVSLAC